MLHRHFEIAFHMNTREVDRAFRIVVDSQGAQEFDLRRFEVAEHRRIMNPAASIGINETNTRLKNKRGRHLIVLPQHSDWPRFRKPGCENRYAHSDGMQSATP